MLHCVQQDILYWLFFTCHFERSEKSVMMDRCFLTGVVDASLRSAGHSCVAGALLRSAGQFFIDYFLFAILSVAKNLLWWTVFPDRCDRCFTAFSRAFLCDRCFTAFGRTLSCGRCFTAFSRAFFVWRRLHCVQQDKENTMIIFVYRIIFSNENNWYT